MQTVIALSLVLAAAAYLARTLARDWRKLTHGCAACGLRRYRKIL